MNTGILNPDWSHLYSSEEALEEDLPPTSFKFDGEGWYFAQGDTALVVEYSGKWLVMVWNSQNAFQEIAKLLAEPIRQWEPE